jgi:hypothetical protein
MKQLDGDEYLEGTSSGRCGLRLTSNLRSACLYFRSSYLMQYVGRLGTPHWEKTYSRLNELFLHENHPMEEWY